MSIHETETTANRGYVWAAAFTSMALPKERRISMMGRTVTVVNEDPEDEILSSKVLMDQITISEKQLAFGNPEVESLETVLREFEDH